MPSLEERDQLVKALRVIKRHCRANLCRRCIMTDYGEQTACKLRREPAQWPDGWVLAFYDCKELTVREWQLLWAALNNSPENPEVTELKKKVEGLIHGW